MHKMHILVIMSIVSLQMPLMLKGAEKKRFSRYDKENPLPAPKKEKIEIGETNIHNPSAWHEHQELKQKRFSTKNNSSIDIAPIQEVFDLLPDDVMQIKHMCVESFKNQTDENPVEYHCNKLYKALHCLQKYNPHATNAEEQKTLQDSCSCIESYTKSKYKEFKLWDFDYSLMHLSDDLHLPPNRTVSAMAQVREIIASKNTRTLYDSITEFFKRER